MNAAAYSLAVVLASGEPERLYSGLSALVSTAAEGQRCAAMAAFRGLQLLLADDLLQRAGSPEATPALSWRGRETFARSLLELRETALDLDALSLWACSASVETMSLDREVVEQRLEGVISTPSFLRRVEGARLVFV